MTHDTLGRLGRNVMDWYLGKWTEPDGSFQARSIFCIIKMTRIFPTVSVATMSGHFIRTDPVSYGLGRLIAASIN